MWMHDKSWGGLLHKLWNGGGRESGFPRVANDWIFFMIRMTSVSCP